MKKRFKNYQVLEHRSDLKIKVWGKTKEELFQNAFLAMFESANYQKEKGKSVNRKIKILSYDLASLLIDFLNELLYLSETKKEVYEKITFEKFKDNFLEGVLRGKKLKRMGVQIKGASYHNLQILKNKKGPWETIVLFDL